MIIMRTLTQQEIQILKQNGCSAENWTTISVHDGFSPEYISRVDFYGEVTLGSFTKEVEVSEGFFLHSGIKNAKLRNCTIGNDCLIENIAYFGDTHPAISVISTQCFY